MNYIFELLLSLVLSASINGSSMTHESFEKTQEAERIEQLKLQDSILSRDYATAKQALDNAIQKKDKATIRLGLKNQILLIKQDVVEAMKEFDDKDFVPDLIMTLENNQVELRGGTEMKIMQRQLDKTIVSALEKLTGLRLSFSENLSKDDVQRILKKSREWWKVRQKEIQQ